MRKARMVQEQYEYRSGFAKRTNERGLRHQFICYRTANPTSVLKTDGEDDGGDQDPNEP